MGQRPPTHNPITCNEALEPFECKPCSLVKMAGPRARTKREKVGVGAELGDGKPIRG